LRRLRKLVCVAGHPRLSSACQGKTWMAGINPAMTVCVSGRIHFNNIEIPGSMLRIAPG
jgi:hypothetical protein